MLVQTRDFNPRRQAILEAADLIEKQPKLFDFFKQVVPRHCGSPGCALGLIGYCAGLSLQDLTGARTPHAREYFPDALVASDVASWLGVHEGEFYGLMDAWVGTAWKHKPGLCVMALRMFADEFYPATVASS